MKGKNSITRKLGTVFCTLALCMWLSGIANSATIAYEGFGGTDGATVTGTTGGSGWGAGGWATTATPQDFVFNTPGLSLGSLDTSGLNATYNGNGTNAQTRWNRLLTAPVTVDGSRPELWAAYLLELNETQAGRGCGIELTNGGTGVVGFGKGVNRGIGIGPVMNPTGSFINSTIARGGITLLVVHLEFDSGSGNTTATLHVAKGSEGGFDMTNVATYFESRAITLTGASTIDGVNLYGYHGGTSSNRLDEVRIGDTLADVVPQAVTGLIALDPPTTLFMSAAGGGSSQSNVVINNSGLGTLNVSGSVITGQSHAGAFTIPVGGGVQAIAPGGSGALTIQFSDAIANLGPNDVATATLEVTSDAGGTPGTVTSLSLEAYLASIFTWNGPTTGTWTESAKWTPVGVPVQEDDAAVAGGEVYRTTKLVVDSQHGTRDDAVSTLTVSSGLLDVDALFQVGTGSQGSVTLNNGELHVVNNVEIGVNGGDGQITQTGGLARLDQAVRIGRSATGFDPAVASYVMVDGSIINDPINASSFVIGYGGNTVATYQQLAGDAYARVGVQVGGFNIGGGPTTSTFDLQGGTFETGGVTLAAGTASAANVSISGGELITGSIVLGGGTLASFDWTTGTISTSLIDIDTTLLNNGGDLKPAGDNIGTLVFDGVTNYSQNAGVVHLQVGNLSSNDQLVVTSGTITLGAGAVIDVTFVDGGPSFDRNIVLIDTENGSTIDVSLAQVNLPISNATLNVVRTSSQLILQVTGLGDPLSVDQLKWLILE